MREEQAIDAVKRFRDAVAEEPILKNSPELEQLRKKLLKEPLYFFKIASSVAIRPQYAAAGPRAAG